MADGLTAGTGSLGGSARTGYGHDAQRRRQQHTARNAPNGAHDVPGARAGAALIEIFSGRKRSRRVHPCQETRGPAGCGAARLSNGHCPSRVGNAHSIIAQHRHPTPIHAGLLTSMDPAASLASSEILQISAAPTRYRGGNHEHHSAGRVRPVVDDGARHRALSVRAEPPKLPVPTVDQSAVAQRGYFYVGGKYVGEPGKEIMQGQIYVEVLAPKDMRRPYPLVLIHGAAQTGDQLDGNAGRPQGLGRILRRAGLRRLHDRPADARPLRRGIRATAGRACSRRRPNSSSSPRSRPTAPGRAAKSTRSGRAKGRTRARRAIRSSTRSTPRRSRHVLNAEETQQRNKDAGAALLDKIGPAIVLTHSQSGAFGWLIADARPQLVKGIVAIEPSGPPFEATIIGTGRTRPWGPTDIPITYDPPVKDPSEIAIEREAKADGPDLFVCWMQKAPARQLVNLKNIPVMIMAAEASYHQLYDHCTAKYLNSGRRQDRVHPAAGQGHPRQRPHGHDREEQSRYRQASSTTGRKRTCDNGTGPFASHLNGAGPEECMIYTPVCDLLDIEHPIALGGMGSISFDGPRGRRVERGRPWRHGLPLSRSGKNPDCDRGVTRADQQAFRIEFSPVRYR